MNLLIVAVGLYSFWLATEVVEELADRWLDQDEHTHSHQRISGRVRLVKPR